MMYIALQNQRKGFTLIEFLLYLALGTVMVTLIGVIGIAAITSSMKARAENEVHYTATYTLETIMRLIEEGSDIIEPLPGETSSSLTIAMGDEIADQVTVSSTEEGVLVEYGDGSTQVIENDAVIVTNLLYTRYEAEQDEDTVSIVLTLQSYNPSGRQSLEVERSYATSVRIPYTP
jgi:hypothetical protein